MNLKNKNLNLKMKNENQIFFEEYKRLDKLLKEVLSSDIGVTAYTGR